MTPTDNERLIAALLPLIAAAANAIAFAIARLIRLVIDSLWPRNRETKRTK